MPNGATSRKKANSARKFSPESPEARDEGPRLIPLATSPKALDSTWGMHALELADIALGQRSSTSAPRKKSKT